MQPMHFIRQPLSSAASDETKMLQQTIKKKNLPCGNRISSEDDMKAVKMHDHLKCHVTLLDWG